MPDPRRWPVPYLLFGATWLLAVAFLSARGQWTWVGAAVSEAGVLGLFVWLTLRLTRPDDGAGAARPSPHSRRPVEAEGPERAAGGEATGDAGPVEAIVRLRLLAQLVVAGALAVLSISELRRLPGWSAVVDVARALGGALPVPDPLWVVNPVLYVVFPGSAVLLLGAHRREIGLRKGWRSWRVIGAWGTPVVAAWVYHVATGQTGVGRILRTLLANTVLNGASEEFLWRGVIQTRLARLWTPAWGLVLASLGFGWWHILSIADWAGADLWLAAALNTVVQAPMGLALGIVFQRTRSLLAPSAVHIVANTVTP